MTMTAWRSFDVTPTGFVWRVVAFVRGGQPRFKIRRVPEKSYARQVMELEFSESRKKRVRR